MKHSLRWRFLFDCRMTSATSTMPHEPVRRQGKLSFHTLIYHTPISFSILPGARTPKRLIYGLSLCSAVLIWNPCRPMAECGLIRHWWDIVFTYSVMQPIPARFSPKAGYPPYRYALAILPCFWMPSHFTFSLLKAHQSFLKLWFGCDC